jgi:hypothetical protein
MLGPPSGGKRRVLYIVDHRHPGTATWSRPRVGTTAVFGSGWHAAARVGEALGVRDSPAVLMGCTVRVRVWSDPDTPLGIDPPTRPAEGTWTHTEAGTSGAVEPAEESPVAYLLGSELLRAGWRSAQDLFEEEARTDLAAWEREMGE